MKPAVPILRFFEESRAKAFYCDFLGFALEWEHRFGENFPLYCQVRRGECVLHLSGHSGDATPGSGLRIEMENVRDYVASLRAKDDVFCKPGEPEAMPWGNVELTLTDPFGNRITLFERGPEPSPEMTPA